MITRMSHFDSNTKSLDHDLKKQFRREKWKRVKIETVESLKGEISLKWLPLPLPHHPPPSAPSSPPPISWLPRSCQRSKNSPPSLFGSHASLKPCCVWLTEVNEDTLRGECFTSNQLDGIFFPDKCFVHLLVSLCFSPSPVTLQSVCQRRCWQVR